jgi:hypothetical protein
LGESVISEQRNQTKGAAEVRKLFPLEDAGGEDTGTTPPVSYDDVVVSLPSHRKTEGQRPEKASGAAVRPPEPDLEADLYQEGLPGLDDDIFDRFSASSEANLDDPLESKGGVLDFQAYLADTANNTGANTTRPPAKEDHARAGSVERDVERRPANAESPETALSQTARVTREMLSGGQRQELKSALLPYAAAALFFAFIAGGTIFYFVAIRLPQDEKISARLTIPPKGKTAQASAQKAIKEADAAPSPQEPPAEVKQPQRQSLDLGSAKSATQDSAAPANQKPPTANSGPAETAPLQSEPSAPAQDEKSSLSDPAPKEQDRASDPPAEAGAHAEASEQPQDIAPQPKEEPQARDATPSPAPKAERPSLIFDPSIFANLDRPSAAPETGTKSEPAPPEGKTEHPYLAFETTILSNNEPQPSPAPPAPKTRTTQLDSAKPRLKISPAEEGRLLEQAREALGNGDVTGARDVLKRLVDEGSGTGAFVMAQTYDPAVVASFGIDGLRGDAKLARTWYAKAYALGNQDALSKMGKKAK